MKIFLKLTLFALMLGNCATFYAAAEKKCIQKYESIHDAIDAEDVEAVRCFIKAKGDINQKNDEGYTPLMIAVLTPISSEIVQIVQMLLVAGADPNIPKSGMLFRGGEEETILCRAYKNIQSLKLEEIESAENDIRMEKVRIKEPMHKEIVRYLIEAGGICPQEEQLLAVQYIDEDQELAVRYMADVKEMVNEIREHRKEQAKKEAAMARPILEQEAKIPKAVITKHIEEYLGVPQE